jgi:hypothetical protein
MVSCRVHQKHAQKHYVTSDAARLRIMNLDCALLTKLVKFDIKETAGVLETFH